MKSTRFFLLLTILFISTVVYAQEVVKPSTTSTNNWGQKMIKSPFGLGLDVQTKYIWRGMEMITEDAAPVLFPSFNYSWKGLYVYAMGGYAINGKYAEVDLGASYSWNGFTICLLYTSPSPRDCS